MQIVLEPGDKLSISFQEHGVTLKSDVTLKFDETGRLTLNSP